MHINRDYGHVTLKIGTPQALENEHRVLRLLKTIKSNHAGSLLVRQMLDEFEVDNKDGVFQCIIHPPLAISVKEFRKLFPSHATRIPTGMLKLVLKHLLLALDFLHTEAKVIHTGKCDKNSGTNNCVRVIEVTIIN